MTQLSSTGAANMNYSYNFPAGANNGKIGSSYNAVTGETIAYQYDSLNRLISAAGSGWGDAYGFDGFGNLLSKTVTAGSAPSLSQAVNSANNRIVGQGYDANGNQTSPPNNSGELLYDAENRLTQNGVSVQYAYDSQNKRVWVGTLVSGSLTSQSANLYGIDGQMLGTYSLSASATGITDPATSLSVYFGRKRVVIVAAGVTTPFVQDRLGSNMSWQVNRVSLYPWGEDRGTPAQNDQIKFATYTRDSATLLDYADQRYYGNAEGRFMSPDPYQGTTGGPGDPGNPQSWNRYAYSTGDPVNYRDPRGLFIDLVSDDGADDDDYGEYYGWDVFSYGGCYPNYDPVWGGYYGCGSYPVPAQTFGGGAPTTFTVTGYSRTGTKETTITNDLNDILNQVLTGGCAKWLTGQDFSASQLITAMETAVSGGPSYGYGALNSNTTAAFVGNSNTNGTPIAGLPADASITVNTNGAFFNSGYTVGFGNTQYTGGTLQAQIFILVHELAHLVGAPGFLSDAGNQANVNSNNALVQKNCGSQIAGVQ